MLCFYKKKINDQKIILLRDLIIELTNNYNGMNDALLIKKYNQSAVNIINNQKTIEAIKKY